MIQGSTKHTVERAWDETSVRINPFKHETDEWKQELNDITLEVQESMKYDVAAFEEIV